MMQPIIQIHDLTKTYHVRKRRGLFASTTCAIQALKGITLDVERGELFGLLGPNGAGKTTLIKCLTSLLFPTSGTAWINGYELRRDEAKVRASIGCMLMGERGLYWKLTGRENLHYFAALYFVPSTERKQRVDALIQRLGLQEFIDRPVESYSSGQKMKLAFAKALVNDAPILILDEPTNTLDVHSARELRAIVQNLNSEGRTIIYTTHLMAEAEALCNRVAIVDRGEIIALATPDELTTRISQSRVVRVRGVIPEQILSTLHCSPMASKVTLTAVNGYDELVVVTSNQRQALPDIIQRLYENGATIEDIVPSHVTLEDVFIALTGRTLEEDARIH